MKKGGRNSVGAFSIVEVIVVILVLSLLVVLISPAANKIYSQAQTAKCLSNIRTYGSAILTMAGENGGLKVWDGKGSSTTETGQPQFNKWLTEGEYIDAKRPLRCPLADGATMQTVVDRYRFPYSGNMSLCQYFPRLVVPAPHSRVVLVGEVNDWDGFTSQTSLNAAIWNGGNPGDEGTARPMARYHGSPEKRGLNFFFLDGSAQLLNPKDNDWRNAPVCAPLTGNAPVGYFYHSTHFANLKNGNLVAP